MTLQKQNTSFPQLRAVRGVLVDGKTHYGYQVKPKEALSIARITVKVPDRNIVQNYFPNNNSFGLINTVVTFIKVQRPPSTGHRIVIARYSTSGRPELARLKPKPNPF